MTREEIISAWEFVEDGLPFDALESKDNRVDMHELIHYTIQALSAEPCEDAINRQMVLDTLDTTEKFMDEDRTVETYKALLKECYVVLPSATPKHKMGRWEWQKEDIYRCSECGEDVHVKEVMNVPQYDFCPNCGVKMEERED